MDLTCGAPVLQSRQAVGNHPNIVEVKGIYFTADHGSTMNLVLEHVQEGPDQNNEHDAHHHELRFPAGPCSGMCSGAVRC